MGGRRGPSARIPWRGVPPTEKKGGPFFSTPPQGGSDIRSEALGTRREGVGAHITPPLRGSDVRSEGDGAHITPPLRGSEVCGEGLGTHGEGVGAHITPPLRGSRETVLGFSVGGSQPTADEVGSLADFAARHAPLFVITGAGCSTESGIFDYRGRDGQWKRKPPVQYDQFIRSEAARQRYWARSHVGWRRFRAARPNPAHFALASLERAGIAGIVVTQNVDGLHQAAGHERVIDLHGRLDTVVCTACGQRTARAKVAEWLTAENPAFETPQHTLAPDGDADFEGVDLSGFGVPRCKSCGGIVKPDVVFFGENVPRARVDTAFDALARCKGVLICGSSVMVQSSFRFCRRAEALQLPIAALNEGLTRADAMLTLKVEARCGPTLAALATRLGC